MKAKILDIPNRIECRVVKRLNRFVVGIELEQSYHLACINNTGRLEEFLIAGRKGFCLANEKPGKTEYKLFALEERGVGAVIDTQLQMRAFEKALELGLIPWLKGCSMLKRNARLGTSLIDYLLECADEKVYLEAKSAVLRDGVHAMYPDCPSSRGRRHIRELTEHVKEGGKAGIFFVAALPYIEAFKPNKAADPELYQLLVEASQAGVQIRSIGMAYQPEAFGIYLFNPDLRINLFEMEHES
ncbi:MAG: DNA/RNA nuclease SfsA [Chloroflexi bacterium]|nr:DNA/RNA nuclease SfsA [Chloroflexota bacterium]